MVTTDPYDEGVEETRQDFTANDFRVTRALDSLLISAKAIQGDPVIAEDIAARVPWPVVPGDLDTLPAWAVAAGDVRSALPLGESVMVPQRT